MTTFNHSPNARLDYGFDWVREGYLEYGETITSSSWVITGDGASLDSFQNHDGVTSVFVTLTAVQSVSKLINSIVTSEGRQDSRTMTLVCGYR